MRYLVAIEVLSLLCVCRASQSNILWIPGMELGGGFDDVTAQIKGLATGSDADLTPRTDAKSQYVSATVVKLEDSQSFSRQIEASLEVSGGYGAFQGSATTSFVNNLEMNSYSVYFLVKVKVVNSETLLTKMTVTPSEAKLDSNLFNSKYGNKYVKGYVSGGELYAVMEIQTKSYSEKNSVSAEATGSGSVGLASFSLTAKFKADFASAAKSHSLRVYVERRGGWGQDLPLETLDQIFEAATKFPSVIGDNGKRLKAILISYNTLQGVNIAPLTGIDVLAVETFKNQLIDVFLQAKSKVDSVKYVMRFNSDASLTETLTTYRDALIVVMQKCRSELNKLSMTPSSSISIPALPSSVGLPTSLLGVKKVEITPPVLFAPGAFVHALIAIKDRIVKISNNHFASKALTAKNLLKDHVGDNLAKIHQFMQYMLYVPKYIENRSVMTTIINVLKTTVDAAKYKISNMNIVDTQNLKNLNDSAVTGTHVEVVKDFLQVVVPYTSTTDSTYGGSYYWIGLERAYTDLNNAIKAVPSGSKVSDYVEVATAIWRTAIDDVTAEKSRLYEYARKRRAVVA